MLNDRAKEIVSGAEAKMADALSFLEEDLKTYRVGKANPAIFNGLMVDYYGSPTPVHQVCSISAPDAKTLALQPWEKNMFPVVEKAIINSNIGIMPINNGEVIRLNIPPLTEERRKQLVKDSKAEAEKARVSVRNARRECIDGLKKAVKDGMSEDVQKDGEEKVQKLHDKYMKQIDELFAAKEKEILTV